MIVTPAATSGHRSPTGLPLGAFDFQPLTRVVFGVGTLARLGELTRELGGQRVLLVTDPGLEAAGHPQRAAESLRAAGLAVVIFDGVEENPTTKHVEAGLEVAKANAIDFLVAVGGGSAMDCAKGINFLLTNGGRMQDYWGVGKATKPMLASIGVPTTAGTGSEAQSFALIADPETHMKMACGDKKAAFRAAILDPVVTTTQPPHVIRFNAVAVGPLYGELAGQAGLANGDPQLGAVKLAERVEALARAAGLPARLSACGVNRAILPVLADEAAQQWTGKFNPRPAGFAELLRLYEEAY